jgi:FkbM family methyltransferase
MDGNLIGSRIIDGMGRIPFFGDFLRGFARNYPEGSVVKIRSGLAAGMKWKRHHRFLNSFWIGQFETGVQNAFGEFIPPGAVVYDIGAHAGFFTLIASRLTGPSGRVFAFDPNPECAASIREQIELNGLANCEVEEKAVGDEDGQVGFRHDGALSRIDVEGTCVVPIVTLDAFARSHPRPDFVKIDVEGAEVAVLRGARTIMGVTFLIEIHGENTRTEVVSLLKEFGYKLIDLSPSKLSSFGKESHIVGLPP